MSWTLNPHKTKNLDYIQSLKQKGYINLGYANGGASFSAPEEERKNNKKETVDCSLYLSTGSSVAYIDHNLKEILWVDSSD